MRPLGSKMKKHSKEEMLNEIEHLRGIAFQMYRILDGLDKSGHIDAQLSPLVEMAIGDFMKYIAEEL
jgi:hypothetical protein